jgi:adenosylhomocysteine nucleosidase
VGAGPLPAAPRGRLSDSQRYGVGVVAALAAEAAVLAGARVLLSGMGPEAAAQAASRLADEGVAALMVFGVAGGLAPGLKPGDLVCPSEIIDEQGRRYTADGFWRARLLARLPPPWDGTLLTVQAPLLSAADKAAACKRSGAIAVDMESAAVAAVAAAAGLPFLVLRAISDSANDAIPAALAGTVDRYGQPRLSRVLAALLRSPALIAELPRLSRGMNAALSSLRKAARAAGPALSFDQP